MRNRIWWMTGLPASGKTSLAHALCEALQAKGQYSFVLDGDELRRGLCADLGLSDYEPPQAAEWVFDTRVHGIADMLAVLLGTATDSDIQRVGVSGPARILT